MRPGQVSCDPHFMVDPNASFQVKAPRMDPGREPSLLELMANTVMEGDSINLKVNRIHAYLFGASPCDEACCNGMLGDVRAMALRTHINAQDVSKMLDDIISRLVAE